MASTEKKITQIMEGLTEVFPNEDHAKLREMAENYIRNSSQNLSQEQKKQHQIRRHRCECILAYLKKNPRARVDEIINGTGFNVTSIRKDLSYLKDAGKVTCVRQGGKAMLWSLKYFF